jgi:hypothetical protein
VGKEERLMTDDVMAEPPHLTPWESIADGLRDLGAQLKQHLAEDRAAFSSLHDRIGGKDGIEDRLEKIYRATRWSKTSVIIGATIGGMLASFALRFAHKFPWLLDAAKGLLP